MSPFKNLFGIKPGEIQKTCIVVPFFQKGFLREFGIEKLQKGKLYSSAQTEHFTLIKAGIGATLMGDAVLYLEETPCQEIVFFGSCGLVKETEQLRIGSLVSPAKCFAFESFTNVLLQHTGNITPCYPHHELFHSFMTQNHPETVYPVTGISLGSIKQEEIYKSFFIEKGIEVVDMECSAFFSAATHAQKKAFALLYVTDVLGKISPFDILAPETEATIHYAVKTACKTLRTFSEDCKK